ncbi:MAG: aminotransferase class V-fold PLP-dependent enzyme [Hyphomicrobiales bacterium]
MTVLLDISALRAETPGCAHRLHLNNAGAGLMPQPVIDAVTDHISLEARIGGSEALAERTDAHEAVYASVASMIGAAPDEIALVENATVAWQRAFYAFDFSEGDRILTARAEYAANYIAYLQVARRTGCVIEVIPDDASGATDPAALEAMIDERVKLISITWIPTNGGLVNPAAEIGRVARAHGIPYLLDACQAAGQMPVDVEEIGCDFLSVTGRKFLRGPRGTGFLYARRSMLDRVEPPMLDLFSAGWSAPDSYELRPDARRFEVWESAPALRLGLGAAVDYAMAVGLETIRERAWGLAEGLRGELARVPGIAVHDIGAERCAIVTFANDRVKADEIAGKMAEQGINVSTSTPSSTLLDATRRALPTVVRASPHYYNTAGELERFLSVLKACT